MSSVNHKKEGQKKVAFAFLMGFITTLIISFSIVSINLGFNSLFLEVWLRSWLLGYVFVIPIILYIAPFIQRVINQLFDEPKDTF